MSIVVVGGQTRKVGKTAVVERIITALQERQWTAVKITQCHHGEVDCDCDLGETDFAINEEVESGDGRDTSRYLAAGAQRAFWLRTKPGGLARAMPTLRGILERAAEVIIESNSVVELLRPDVFLCVIGTAGVDVKPSYRRVVDSADAFVAPSREAVAVGGKPLFSLHGPNLSEWLRAKLYEQEKSAPPIAVRFVK